MRNKFFTLLLCAAACPMLQAQITLDRSEVQINLKYNGQPASQAAPGFYFNISFGSYGAEMFQDSTVFTDSIPANYTVEVRFPGSAAVLASFPIVASGGARVTLDIELNGFAGIYRGSYLQYLAPVAVLVASVTMEVESSHTLRTSIPNFSQGWHRLQ